MALINTITSALANDEDAVPDGGRVLQKQAEASLKTRQKTGHERNPETIASAAGKSAPMKAEPEKRSPAPRTSVAQGQGIAVATAVNSNRARWPHRATTPAQKKTDIVLKKLRLARGVTIAQLAEVTGWQLHSVRGFLSGTVRKKLGLRLISDTGRDGIRRYRIDDGGTSGKAG
ncbi:DUF3489 domain-containing protein [Pseudochelatococcus lubricantis]|uniref:DUF3489 domain-containing protein n=1 Tax=Pseudochelatococcus lubricantis TaxID=1538102 RepID=UPI0035E93909